ncbi:MAG: tetratricopeptide repeat protein [Hyphomicrobiales bacterium]|nr:tetratricopeptide repeat protein [Hyphomicrobiales bacterium]
MADIFNEIDEELRQEKLKKLWDRWGVAILGVAVAIVLAVAGWRLWDHYRQKAAEAQGAAYVAATELAASGETRAAEDALLALSKTSSGGYPAIAAMRAAGVRAASGETEAALAAFDALAADPKTPQRFAEMARIRAAYLALDLDDRAAAESRALPLAAAGLPYRAEAREILALAAWKAGDAKAVSSRLAEIEADPETPRDVLERVAVLGALVKAQGADGKAN